MNDKTKFFLGANSHMDFVSYFKQLQEQSDSMQLLILKGGPGSGKSSLMKKVAAYAMQQGNEFEIIPCASDPESLDAVIDKTARFAIMDGTAPHTEDPSLPGVLHHIMYTGDLWNCDKLNQNKEEIALLNDTIGDYHKAAGAYIKAASALLSENLSYSRKFINKAAAAQYIEKAAGKLPQGSYGKEKQRLLSAVSVGEIKFYEETIPAMADKIYVVEDDWGGASDYIFKAIRNSAKIYGTDIIHCPCSIMPEKTDHIIVPEARIAFSVTNKFLKTSYGEKVSADLFYNEIPDSNLMEKRLSDAQKLLPRACALVKEAKKLHDKLEVFYVNAMNFEKMGGFLESIKDRFYR